jgi:short-subunit dehydrogenase
VALAVITGPTAGIGRSFATALAREGHDLILVARDEDRLRSVAAELRGQYAVKCTVLVADLADLDATRVVEERVRRSGVNVLVNNAGFGLQRSFEVNDVEAEQRGLDVLVRAVLRLTHAALEPMLARGSGDIVNVSSVAGFLPRGTYGAHKAWVTDFSAWAHGHYAQQGLRVLALCPGFVRTEFHTRMDADMSRIPSWMWLAADDVVAAGLRDLRANKAISIPSRRYQALVAASKLTPKGVIERLVRRTQ